MQNLRLNKKHAYVFIFLLLTAVSVASFYSAPDKYSESYCIYSLVLFLVSGLFYLIIQKKKNFFDFDVLFLFTCFFVYYLYPVFVYPINPEYFIMFMYAFNHDVITKATALVTVGVTAYLTGAVLVETTMESTGNRDIKIVPKQIPGILSFVLFLIVLIRLDSSAFSSKYDGTELGGILSYIFLAFSAFFSITIILEFNNLYARGVHSTKSLVLQFDKVLLIYLVVFLAIFLYLGYRTFPLQIMILVTALYSSLIKPVNWRKFLLIAMMGLFFMSFIQILRSSRGNNSDVSRFSFGIIDAGMDLIINNRNLYVAVDYVDKHGVNYGTTMVGNVLAPVPFLQRFTNMLFDIDPSSTTSSRFFTALQFGQNKGWGLGTNIVADVFLSFGLPGTILLLGALGYFVNKTKALAEKGYFYPLISYSILVSYAIYLVRAEFFFFLRLLLWALLLGILFKSYPFFIRIKWPIGKTK
jgi:hypothetical protein